MSHPLLVPCKLPSRLRSCCFCLLPHGAASAQGQAGAGGCSWAGLGGGCPPVWSAWAHRRCLLTHVFLSAWPRHLLFHSLGCSLFLSLFCPKPSQIWLILLKHLPTSDTGRGERLISGLQLHREPWSSWRDVVGRPGPAYLKHQVQGPHTGLKRPRGVLAPGCRRGLQTRAFPCKAPAPAGWRPLLLGCPCSQAGC